MSEHVRLGEADARPRWAGVRRHQAVLVVVGVGLLSDCLLRTRAGVEGGFGALVVLAAAPLLDARTLGEYVVDAVRFVARRRWYAISALRSDDDLVVWAGGDATFRGYELLHRGRLDLSGADVEVASALSTWAEAASAAVGERHFSLHVHERRRSRTTLLALPIESDAPDSWRLNADLALEVLGLGDTTSVRDLERPTYVRRGSDLLRVYRIRDFSSVAASGALLAKVLRSPNPREFSLHVNVVPGSRASGVAARAVHRVDSDDVVSRAVGYRRDARTTRLLRRLNERETLVAEGRALLQVGGYFVLRASSLRALREAGRELWRDAHDAGLRLDRGWARQAAWQRAQLPGGAGW